MAISPYIYYSTNFYISHLVTLPEFPMVQVVPLLACDPVLGLPSFTCFLGQVSPARTIPPCPASCMASNGLHAIDQFALVLALGEAVRLDLPKDGGLPHSSFQKPLEPDCSSKNNWKTVPSNHIIQGITS